VSAALVAQEAFPAEPETLLGFAPRLVPGSVFEGLDEAVCPVCRHSFEAHRRVYPWDDPPMLLCFVLVEGQRCFSECGACRRDDP
jgi:hypothetical protein